MSKLGKLPVAGVEVGAAVGVFFGGKARRRVRLPTANPSLFFTVVVETSAQLNRMFFRVFDPMGTEFAILQLQGMSIEELSAARKPVAVRVYRRKMDKIDSRRIANEITESTGCWACEGNQLDCTCDVDWDAMYESRHG
jgi:hypothetical protein